MFYTEDKKQYSVLNRRTFFLYILKLSLFSIVGWRLYNIQIKESDKYKTLSKNNQIDIEIIYPLRGKIFDINNNLLVSNKKVFDIYIIPENTKNLNKTLNQISEILKIDFSKKRKIIELSKKVQKFEKIKIFENVNWHDLEKIETNKLNIDGIFIAQDYMRVYQYGNIFSHLLGYINKPNSEELSLPFIANMPDLDIGKEGLEKNFNSILVGKSGQREIEVNSFGRIIREISRVDSNKGNDLQITLDFRLQQYSMNLLNAHRAGSVVVMNIENGDIKTIASTPFYDPNKIIKKPNKDYWDSLLSNNLSPLTFRSVQGLYAPGSTFKMIVAIAGLYYGVINNDTQHFCNGKIALGDRLYHCWKNNGHGSMNVQNAIKESCDVFFYEISKKIGIDRIAQVAKDFGLGKIYDLPISNQKMGIVPSKDWKKKKIGESWYPGETLISAIGQGFVLANPLQLATMTSIIASNGKLIEPKIINDGNYKQVKKLEKYSSAINVIKQSMFKVVNESKGTAFRSKSDDFIFSGKTGTSQVRRITVAERESDDFRKKEIEWEKRDHALFVGYMPHDKPKYAVSVVIEHGGSGAKTAAPIAKQIFQFINKNNI
tara:strand:+ start:1090 stop:2892 length:1803 start_codon:yes stop_codon:yes gene_type:complete